MAEKKTNIGKRLWDKLFGTKNCCCSIQIEEIEKTVDLPEKDAPLENQPSKEKDGENASNGT